MTVQLGPSFGCAVEEPVCPVIKSSLAHSLPVQLLQTTETHSHTTSSRCRIFTGLLGSQYLCTIVKCGAKMVSSCSFTLLINNEDRKKCIINTSRFSSLSMTRKLRVNKILAMQSLLESKGATKLLRNMPLLLLNIESVSTNKTSIKYKVITVEQSGSCKCI